MYQNIAPIITGLLILPGIVMAFVPMLPALTYMFIVSLIFAFINGFQKLSVHEILVLLCITGASILVDHISGILGAKFGGAHTKSLFFGFIGSVLGTFIFPVVGSFFGLFLGVLISELCFRRKIAGAKDQAFKAAGSALVGSLSGVAFNVVLATVFTILFFYFVFF
jgi:uncharacterized protein